MVELETNAAALDGAAVEELTAAVAGPVVRSDSPDYDAARAVWNGSFDRRPALVVRATGAADVVATVNFARENGVLLAVRGGGHSVPGHSTCDNGVVLDLSLLQ